MRSRDGYDGLMYAVRARHAFDGTRFLEGGATVLVQDGRIVGVERHGYAVPDGCPVTTYDGTLLPGLFDMHTHLVADSGPDALDRVADCTDEQLDAAVTEALRRQLAAGVTTVRESALCRPVAVRRRGQPLT